MSGKMSTGVVRIEATPRIKIKIAMTTNVYGRLSASLTIHIVFASFVFLRCGKRFFAHATLRCFKNRPVVYYRQLPQKPLRMIVCFPFHMRNTCNRACWERSASPMRVSPNTVMEVPTLFTSQPILRKKFSDGDNESSEKKLN